MGGMSGSSRRRSRSSRSRSSRRILVKDPFCPTQGDAEARTVILRDESARVAANDRLGAADKARIVAEKSAAIMGPVVTDLRR